MLADLREHLELTMARRGPELGPGSEPAVTVDDLVEDDRCNLRAKAPRPRLGRVTGSLLVVAAAHWLSASPRRSRIVVLLTSWVRLRSPGCQFGQRQAKFGPNSPVSRS